MVVELVDVSTISMKRMTFAVLGDDGDVARYGLAKHVQVVVVVVNESE